MCSATAAVKADVSPAITEADVVAFMRSQCARVAARITHARGSGETAGEGRGACAGRVATGHQ